MSFMNIVLTYLLTIPVFLGIDFMWLAVIARNMYQKQLGFIMSKEVNWLAAGAFYLLFVAGLIILVVLPNLENGSLFKTIAYGALLGLIAYATYDLTNLATIKGWPLSVTLIDLVWGMVLSGITAGTAFLIGSRLR